MKPLIIANWKMNPKSVKEAKALFSKIKMAAKNREPEVVICPPFAYLPLLKGLPLCAEDVFYKEKGAFTGEISPSQLKDLKTKYVLIGHSERRIHFGETDEIVNKKIKAALAAGLEPVLCVGENKGGSKTEVLQQQISEGLRGVSRQKAKNTIIAYEPVWAIGTGDNCSIEETRQSVLLTKKILTGIYGKETAGKIRVLYGGSVNSKNVASYIKESDVDGLLVGGASLDPEEFTKIIKSVK